MPAKQAACNLGVRAKEYNQLSRATAWYMEEVERGKAYFDACMNQQIRSEYLDNHAKAS